jgi:hypothetical protein
MTASPHSTYIERVKGLGTTWYGRGPGYWTRRVGLSTVYLALAIGGGVLSFFLLRTFWVDRSIPRALATIVTVIGVGVAVATAVVTWRAYRKAERDDLQQSKKKRGGIFAASAGIVGLARMTALGLIMLAVCFFITFGGMTVTFLYSLRPEFFGEHQARLRAQPRKNHTGTRPSRKGH